MTTGEHPAALLARRIITELRAGGVRHVVLAPGSRSAPLAYALVAAAEAGWLRLHVRIDERVAGFVGLGLARATGAAVAVVTTSGTAVANLHPAALEAAHSGVPLVFVSADRPHEMRAAGANQTTDQVGMFAAASRWQVDIPADTRPGDAAQTVVRALAAATGVRSGDPGPVHLNVGLRDPLVPATTWQPGPAPYRRVPIDAHGPVGACEVPAGGRVVVVAGSGAGPTAARVAEAGGWPLLAEPSSGARTGLNVIDGYRLVLAELAEEVTGVLVFGHPTLSRPVSALLARDDIEISVVAPTGAVWPDVTGAARRVVGAIRVAGIAPDGAWLERWRTAGQAAADVLTQHAETAFDGLAVARLIARARPAGGPVPAPRPGAEPAAPVAGDGRAPASGSLVVGSSMAVRDLDLASPAWSPDAPEVVANRGLAGIDGTIGTAVGIALARRHPVRVLLGDLTFLHDAGALLRGELEEDVDLQVIVLNDHGGTIFATLEHGAPERAGTFERVFGTPQRVDLAALSAGYGAGHRRVRTATELVAALAEPIRGRSVVEVVLDRTEVRAQRGALTERVAAAVRDSLPPR